jgi:hypothetical protein
VHALHLPTTLIRGTLHIDRAAIPGIGMLLLALGMATSAALGPLGLDIVTFPVSPAMENQLIGGEIVSLLVAAPVAAVAGVLWLRGHPLAPVAAIGPAIYAAYMYTQYVVGPEYSRYEGNSERACPLYLLLVLFGWLLAARSWIVLGGLDLPAPGLRLGRGLGLGLTGLNALFALAWIVSLVPVVAGNNPSAEYLADQTLFWTVRLMDLGFVIPVGLITGIALLRSHPAATRLTYAWLGAQTLLTAAVGGMAWVMQLRDDPSANPAFLVATTAMALAFGVVYATLWRRAAGAHEATPDAVPASG